MADMNDKVIHFGEFIRWNRTCAGKTTEQFSREVGVTARRLIAIETMARPDVHPSTLSRLANTLGIPPEDFDQVWQSTPVPVTKRKPGPTTDEAQRFARAVRRRRLPRMRRCAGYVRGFSSSRWKCRSKRFNSSRRIAGLQPAHLLPRWIIFRSRPTRRTAGFLARLPVRPNHRDRRHIRKQASLTATATSHARSSSGTSFEIFSSLAW